MTTKEQALEASAFATEIASLNDDGSITIARPSMNEWPEWYRTFIQSLPDAQEPVGWRRKSDGWLNEQGRGEPLYTSPQPDLTERVKELEAFVADISREELAHLRGAALGIVSEWKRAAKALQERG